MSVQPGTSRPATKSVGAAFVDILLTLAIFALLFLAFLIAPLLLLALAFLVYAVMRPRGRKKTAAAAGGSPSGPPAAAHGFGSGTAS